MRKDDAEISDWDVADYLKTEIEVRYFLEEILNANDPKLLQMALGDVARSAGMAKIAKKAGLNRESLYKALKEEAHPRFETVMRVFNAMGMKLSLTPYVAEKPAKYSSKVAISLAMPLKYRLCVFSLRVLRHTCSIGFKSGE